MHTSEQLCGFKTQIIIVLRDLYNPKTKKQFSHVIRTDSEVVRESPPLGGGLYWLGAGAPDDRVRC